MNQNGFEGVLGRVAGFGENLAGLAELQAQLAAVELKQCASKASGPSAAIALALTILGAGCFCLLIGAAYALIEIYGLKPSRAFLAVGFSALVISSTALVLASRAFGKALQSFSRTQEEFNRNSHWIKTVLLHSGRSIPR